MCTNKSPWIFKFPIYTYLKVWPPRHFWCRHHSRSKSNRDLPAYRSWVSPSLAIKVEPRRSGLPYARGKYMPCPGAHSSTMLVRIPQCRYRPPTLGTPSTINPFSLPHPRCSMKTNALIIVSRATNAVAPAPTTPFKAEEMTESTVEVMVRSTLPATGVNTGQSTSIMIMCTVLEFNLGTATWSLLSQHTPWVSLAQ